MLLQGFPDNYQLKGTLSAQIDQVSEAVPPPLAQVVAESIGKTLIRARGQHGMAEHKGHGAKSNRDVA